MKNDLHIFRRVVYNTYNDFTVRRRCNALGLLIANRAMAILSVRLSHSRMHYIAVVKHRMIGRCKCDVHFLIFNRTTKCYIARDML